MNQVNVISFYLYGVTKTSRARRKLRCNLMHAELKTRIFQRKIPYFPPPSPITALTSENVAVKTIHVKISYLYKNPTRENCGIANI